jgi:hypothetical protein
MKKTLNKNSSSKSKTQNKSKNKKNYSSKTKKNKNKKMIGGADKYRDIDDFVNQNRKFLLNDYVKSHDIPDNTILDLLTKEFITNEISEIDNLSKKTTNNKYPNDFYEIYIKIYKKILKILEQVPELANSIQDRVALLSDLKEIVRRNDVFLYYKNSNMSGIYSSLHNILMSSDRNGHFLFGVIEPQMSRIEYDDYKEFLNNRYVQPPADVLRAISKQEEGISYSQTAENSNRRRERFENTERERLANIERERERLANIERERLANIERENREREARVREARERQIREREHRAEIARREREASDLEIMRSGRYNSNNNNNSPPSYSLEPPSRSDANNIRAFTRELRRGARTDRINRMRYESLARGQLVPLGLEPAPEYENPPGYEKPISYRQSMPLELPNNNNSKTQRQTLRRRRNSKENGNGN